MSKKRGIIDTALAVFYGFLAMIFLLIGIAEALQTKTQLSLLLVSAIAALFLGKASHKRWALQPHQANASHTSKHQDVRELQTGEFYTRVVGVSHSNTDGSDRQAAIRTYCRPGAPLSMVREPKNSFNSNAIGVYCAGHQIGYLRSEIAEQYAPDIDAGDLVLSGRITEITGGTRDKPTLGVNIVLSMTEQQ